MLMWLVSNCIYAVLEGIKLVTSTVLCIKGLLHGEVCHPVSGDTP